ncbi:MAG: exo-alpha-sialidase [Acidobacteria bacterium]|nr:exo-alpha-sialidase [Acidobacteriota bacterium]
MEINKTLAKCLLVTLFAQFFILPSTNLAQEINKTRKRVDSPSSLYNQYLQRKNARQKPVGYERLQNPKIFNSLSSAGQRGVLMAMDPLTSQRNSASSISNLSSDIGSIPNISPLAQGDDNTLVNNPVLDRGLTQSESSIAARNNTVIVGYNSAPGNSDLNFSGYSRSTNGGQTFTQGIIPNLPNGLNLGDAVVDFGPNGEIYYSTLTLLIEDTGVKSIIGVAKSTDQGATFSTPVDATTTAANNLDFQDKEWLTVDKNANSPFKGNVYVSWTTFSENISINFSRSIDGGQTYLPPISLSQGDNSAGVQGSMPAVAPNGDLYVAYFRVGNGDITASDFLTISLVKSTDGGKTFSPSKSVASIFNTANLTGGIDGSGVRTNSFPSIVVDQKGTVHIVYGATPSKPSTPTGADRGDIFYIRSTDGGNTFSSPLRINDDTTSTSQSSPSIAVTTDGTVGIRWWDRRNDPVFDSLTDVFMATSTNGGASFSSNFQVNNHNWSFGEIERGVAPGYHGDYDSLTAFGNDFYIAWSDERNENPDIYFNKLPSNFNAKTPDFSLSSKGFYGVVIAGQQTTFPLQLFDRNSFSDNITLSATSAVSGLSYSFSPASARSNQAVTLTVSANSSVAPGTYLVVVSGSSGSKTRRTNLRLTVFPANHTNGLPMNVSNNRGDTNLLLDGVRVDSKGTIHMAFVDNSNADIPRDSIIEFEAKPFYKQSTDGGKTFSTPVKIVETFPISNIFANAPVIAVDERNNIIYAAFTGSILFSPTTGESGVFLVKSTDGGKTFSNPVMAVGSTKLNDCIPSSVIMELDRLGNLIIATPTGFCLVQSEDEDLTQRVGIFVVRSKDRGNTFTNPERISLVGESIQFGSQPKLAFDSQGSIYLAYPYVAMTEDFNVNLGIKVAIDSGTGFNKMNQVFLNKRVFDIIDNNSEPILSDFPQIGLALDNNNVYVSFELIAPPFDFSRPAILNTHLARSTDKGRTFSNPINVSKDNNTSLTGYTNVFLAQNGTVNVAWRSRNGLLLATSRDGGQTFGNSKTLSGPTGTFTRGLDTLGVVNDGKGGFYAFWNGCISAQFETYLCNIPSRALFPKQQNKTATKPTPNFTNGGFFLIGDKKHQ